MKSFSIFLFILSLALTTYSQDENLQFKLDSIVKEADLLYYYEKVAWNASDLFNADKKLKKNFGGYVISHSNDTVTASFLNEEQKEVIARYYFTTSNLDKPYKTEVQTSPFTDIERNLFLFKVKMIDQLSDSEYELRIPEDFDPNFILLKDQNMFKLYMIMGTSKTGIIPLGNDYLFNANEKGKITSWKKFHVGMIPIEVPGGKGTEILSSTHSHKLTPYISATDICTFRLYASYCGLKEFKVYCTKTQTTYKYSIKKNKIEVTEL